MSLASCQQALHLLVSASAVQHMQTRSTKYPLRRRSRDFLDLQLGIRRGRSHRGVPKEVLDSLPCHEFKPSELAAADGAMVAAVEGLPVPPTPAPAAVTLGSRAVAAPEVAANECSVCLCEYEEGEMVRTLVNCRCNWLVTHHMSCCISSRCDDAGDAHTPLLFAMLSLLSLASESDLLP